MRYRVIYALPTLRLRYACATALLSLSITFRSPYRLHIRDPSEYLRLSMTEYPLPGFLSVFGNYVDGVVGEY